LGKRLRATNDFFDKTSGGGFVLLPVVVPTKLYPPVVDLLSVPPVVVPPVAELPPLVDVALNVPLHPPRIDCLYRTHMYRAAISWQRVGGDGSTRTIPYAATVVIIRRPRSPPDPPLINVG
jgi:hypothetical protein